MPNQGIVALGALAVVVVGGTIIYLGINAWLKSEPKPRRQPPKPFPTGPRRDDPQDQMIYDKINRLVAFFVAQMRQGTVAMNPRRPRWTPSRTMRALIPQATTLPQEITIGRRAWWGGPDGYSCITPDGQWEYYGSCQSYREGTTDEFDAWWVVSSKHFKRSVAVRDPYPFNMYLVLDSGTATLAHALQVMGDMMEQILTRHRPHAVAEFRRLRHQ